MATRWYLPSTGAAAVSPPISGAWNFNTASPSRLAMVRTRINSAMVNSGPVAETSTTQLNIFHRQYVSEQIAAQTISGTMLAMVRASESANNANMAGQLVAYVVSGDGATVRGVLYAGTNSTGAGNPTGEYTTTLSSRAFPGTGTVIVENVVAQNGDRIVVEFGTRSHNTSATSWSSTLNFGDNSATDLTTTAGVTTANNPWVEFSMDIAEFDPNATADLTTGGATVTCHALTATGQANATADLTTAAVSVTGHALTATWTDPVFIHDTFTETVNTELAVHTGEVGASWEAPPTATLAWLVTPDGLIYKRASQTNNIPIASGLPGREEYDVEVTFRLNNASGYIGVFGRFDPATGISYRAAVNSTGITLSRATGFGSSITLTSAAISISTTVDHRLRLEIRNHRKSVYLNDTRLLESYDNTLQGAGRVALYATGGNAGDTPGPSSTITSVTATNVDEEPLPAGTFLHDTFTDVDGTLLTAHTGELGATWSRTINGADSAQLEIQSNRAWPTATGLVWASAMPPSAEYDVTAELLTTGAISTPSPAARINTATGECYLVTAGASTWVLQRRASNGTKTTLASTSHVFQTSSVTTVTLQVRDTHKAVIVNGASLLYSTDNTFAAAGRVGLQVQNVGTVSNSLHIDRLTAYPPPAVVQSDATADLSTRVVSVTGHMLGANVIPALGSVVIHDTFTDTDGTALNAHTGETGATWDGVGTISGGRMASASFATGSIAYASGVPESADYLIETDAIFLTLDGSVHILFRWVPRTGNYYAVLHNLNGLFLSLVINGVSSTLASLTHAALPRPTTLTTYRIEATGSLIRVYVGGVLRLEAIDSTHTSPGRIAIGGSAGNTATTGGNYDSITVTNYGSVAADATATLSHTTNTVTSYALTATAGAVVNLATPTVSVTGHALTATGEVGAINGTAALSTTTVAVTGHALTATASVTANLATATVAVTTHELTGRAGATANLMVATIGSTEYPLTATADTNVDLTTGQVLASGHELAAGAGTSASIDTITVTATTYELTATGQRNEVASLPHTEISVTAFPLEATGQRNETAALTTTALAVVRYELSATAGASADIDTATITVTGHEIAIIAGQSAAAIIDHVEITVSGHELEASASVTAEIDHTVVAVIGYEITAVAIARDTIAGITWSIPPDRLSISAVIPADTIAASVSILEPGVGVAIESGPEPAALATEPGLGPVAVTITAGAEPVSIAYAEPASSEDFVAGISWRMYPEPVGAVVSTAPEPAILDLGVPQDTVAVAFGPGEEALGLAMEPGIDALAISLAPYGNPVGVSLVPGQETLVAVLSVRESEAQS